MASVAEEVAALKKVQEKCIQEQMRLDEESLERLKAAEEVKKVLFLPYIVRTQYQERDPCTLGQ